MKSRGFSVMLMLVIFLVALPLQALGGQVIGTVTRVKGTAQIFRQSLSEPIMVARGMAVELDDRIRTAPDSSVRLALADESIVSLGERASLKLDEFEYSPAESKRAATLEMALGKVLVFTKEIKKLKANRFQIKTPTAVVGVRGTLFVVWVVSDAITKVSCFESEVEVYNVFHPDEIVVLQPNASTDVIRRNPPTAPVLMNQEQLQELRQNLSQAPGTDNGPIDVPDASPAVGPTRRALGGDATGTYLQAPGVENPGAIGYTNPSVTGGTVKMGDFTIQE